MPLVYNFNYNDAAYAGLAATVVDQVHGGEVAGSPLTLDASGNGSLSLDEGLYLATVSNAALGRSSAATSGVLDVPDSIEAGSGGGGGGGGVSGPAAWFTLETDTTDLTTKQYVTFTEMDDGRATPRPDLVAVDGSDSTTLNVVEGGEYLVSLTIGANKGGGTVDTDGLVRFSGNVEVNGDNEAPAYYMTAESLFIASDSTGQPASLTFHQTFEEGDTIQVGGRIRLRTAEGTGLLWNVSGSVIGLTKIG